MLLQKKKKHEEMNEECWKKILKEDEGGVRGKGMGKYRSQK